MKCPKCNRLYLTLNRYAKHRRHELADWLDQCGEIEQAARTRGAELKRFMPEHEAWLFGSDGKWRRQLEDQVWPIK
jgi:hypothetical protein